MLNSPDNTAQIRAFLSSFVDASREGLQETPDRVRKAFEFWLSGYSQDPKTILKVFEDGAENYDEMVTVGGIQFFSLCEHHLTPFFGVAHVGYIPKGKIIGLSKIPRLVEMFSRRLQVQERLTQEIANALWANLDPKAVGVVIRARHLCMESRGVQKPGTLTYTSKMMGAFRNDPSARTEFLDFVRQTDNLAGRV